jgi:capsule polysaccharide export protein KpsE/RkpR
MVHRFDLVKRWELKRRDQAREQLAASTAFITPREGHMIITVEAETARLAQEMAAAYATLSARESARLRTSLAAQRRQYLEVRLAEIDREAALAASRMRAFEERHGAVSLPDQARETMSAGAQLQAQVAMLETELAAARSYYTDRSPQVQILRERIAEMKRQVERLARQGGTMRVAGTDLPALKQEFLHLTQEQVSLAEVSAALRRLYEQSRVEEANPVPSFAVLDAAELPERHAGPKRALTLAIALTLCTAFTTGWVFLAENHFLPARVAGWGLPRGAAADSRVSSEAESEPGQERRAA